MKKIIASTIAFIAISSNLYSDIVKLDFKIGGLKSQIDKGYVTDTTVSHSSIDLKDATGFDKGQNLYIWLRIKHPAPVLPNIKLEYNSFDYDGKLKSNVLFDNTNFSVNNNNKLALNEIDSVLYYNLLDNTFYTTVDVGLDVRYLHAKYSIDNGINSVSYKVDKIIPLAYLRGRFEIPFTHLGIPLMNLGLDADAKYLHYDGNTVSDYSIKFDYTFTNLPSIKPSFEIGYRIKKYEINESNNININANFSGVFIGAGLNF